MIEEIISIECDTVEKAEQEYFQRKAEGCWQMVNPIKIVFSYKKFGYVARFSMKKVEKAYHIDDHMRDIFNMITYACQVGIQVADTMSKVKARKMLNKFKPK